MQRMWVRYLLIILFVTMSLTAHYIAAFLVPEDGRADVQFLVQGVFTVLGLLLAAVTGFGPAKSAYESLPMGKRRVPEDHEEDANDVAGEEERVPLSRKGLLRCAVALVGLFAFSIEAGRDVWTQKDPIWVVSIHGGGAVAALFLFLGLGISVWQDRQIRYFERDLQQLLAQLRATFPWRNAMGPDQHQVGRRDALDNMRDALECLYRSVDFGFLGLPMKAERIWKGPRFIGVYVPEEVDCLAARHPYGSRKGRFRCVAASGGSPSYYNLATKFTPAITDPAGLASFLAANGEVPKGSLVERERYAKKKRRYTSALGEVWEDRENTGPDSFVLIEDTMEELGSKRPDYHVSLVPGRYLDKKPFRSLYIRPLWVRGEAMGLLVLADPVKMGLSYVNPNILSGVTHVLETALARHLAFSEGCGVRPWFNVWDDVEWET